MRSIINMILISPAKGAPKQQHTKHEQAGGQNVVAGEPPYEEQGNHKHCRKDINEDYAILKKGSST